MFYTSDKPNYITYKNIDIHNFYVMYVAVSITCLTFLCNSLILLLLLLLLHNINVMYYRKGIFSNVHLSYVTCSVG